MGECECVCVCVCECECVRTRARMSHNGKPNVPTLTFEVNHPPNILENVAQWSTLLRVASVTPPHIYIKACTVFRFRPRAISIAPLSAMPLP